MVSTSVQPARDSRSSSWTVTPNAGRITTSSGPSGVGILVRIGKETDVLGAQLIVDVRVVDDFAGQEDVAIGEALARLIGIVDGAIDAVAEAEFTRENNREPSAGKAVVVRFDLLNEIAVVALRQDPGDGVLEVESLSKDDRLRHSGQRPIASRSAAVGVNPSSARSDCARRSLTETSTSSISSSSVRRRCRGCRNQHPRRSAAGRTPATIADSRGRDGLRGRGEAFGPPPAR